MSDRGADFLIFLKANYPEDYNKLSTDSVADSMVNAIINKHKSHFEVWKKVPASIRDEYRGKVPFDIIEAAKTDNNLTLDECRTIEAERGDYKSSADMGDFQNKLLDDYNSGKMSKEAFGEAWREMRQKQLKSVKQEWIEKQPEKMLIHIAKQLNLGKIDKETALPQMDVLMKKVKDMGREQQLSEYLKQPKSGYNKLNEDNKLLFNELMLSHEVGSVAQNLNKVRNMTTKDISAQETKPTPVPNRNKTLKQTKIRNSKTLPVQER